MAGGSNPRDYCREVRNKRNQVMSPETTKMDSLPSKSILYKNGRGLEPPETIIEKSATNTAWFEPRDFP
jgi:hypothetical protein